MRSHSGLSAADKTAKISAGEATAAPSLRTTTLAAAAANHSSALGRETNQEGQCEHGRYRIASPGGIDHAAAAERRNVIGRSSGSKERHALTPARNEEHLCCKEIEQGRARFF